MMKPEPSARAGRSGGAMSGRPGSSSKKSSNGEPGGNPGNGIRWSGSISRVLVTVKTAGSLVLTRSEKSEDRPSVVQGKSVSVSVGRGCCGIIKNKTQNQTHHAAPSTN